MDILAIGLVLRDGTVAVLAGTTTIGESVTFACDVRAALPILELVAAGLEPVCEVEAWQVLQVLGIV